jgi:hypothetical protein
VLRPHAGLRRCKGPATKDGSAKLASASRERSRASLSALGCSSTGSVLPGRTSHPRTSRKTSCASAAGATFEPRPSLWMPANFRTSADHRSVTFCCQFRTSRKLDALGKWATGPPGVCSDPVQIGISGHPECTVPLDRAAQASRSGGDGYRPRMTGSLKIEENGAAELESIGMPKPSVVG